MPRPLPHSWKETSDPWDTTIGLVAAHQLFADRVAELSADLLAALDGDVAITGRGPAGRTVGHRQLAM